MKMSKISLLLMGIILLCNFYANIPEGVCLKGRGSDISLAPVSDAYFHADFSANEAIQGYFDVHEEEWEVTLYIMNDANYALYSEGKSFVSYVNMRAHAEHFAFTAPEEGYYYILFHNTYLFYSINVDAVFDNEEILLPEYSDHEYYSNYQLLAPESRYSVGVVCAVGENISGYIASIYWTDFFDIFFCDWNNYAKLDDPGAIIVEYNVRTDILYEIISFTPPSSDMWFMVIKSNGETDAVSFAYYLDVLIPITTTSTTTSTTTTTSSTSTTTESTTTTTTSDTSSTTSNIFRGIPGYRYLSIGLVIGIGIIIIRLRKFNR